MMQTVNRRRFVQYLAAGTAATAAAGWAVSGLSARAQAVVIGGGPAGATAALALRQARPAASILLVERDPGRLGRDAASAFDRPIAGPDLATLRQAGVAVVLDEVAELDWRAGSVHLFSGRALAFDQLTLAPGTAPVDEAIPGLDPAARHRWPAAWGSAREARRLAAQLAALPEAGHVVLRLPSRPSHPEAALDRALALATLLEHTRPRSRLTVLDGGTGDRLATRFAQQLARRGLGLATDWRTGPNGGTVIGIDARRGILDTTAGPLRADVVNFVGPRGAGRIAQTAGLVDASGWCPTDALGRSLHRPGAVILGDARKGAQRTVAGAVHSGRALVQGPPTV